MTLRDDRRGNTSHFLLLAAALHPQRWFFCVCVTSGVNSCLVVMVTCSEMQNELLRLKLEAEITTEWSGWMTTAGLKGVSNFLVIN